MPEKDRFARRVALKVKQDRLREFLSLVRREVKPSLVKEKGLRRFYLITAVENTNEFVSLTLWNSKREADNYAKSGRYEENMSKVKALLEGEPALSQYHVELHSVGSAVSERPAKTRRRK